MPQQLDGFAIDPKAVNSPYEEARKAEIGELVFGIRIDSLPRSDAKRLAGEGKFYPLTMDDAGQLRVTLPEDTEVKTQELEVLLRIEALLVEQRNLLLKIT